MTKDINKNNLVIASYYKKSDSNKQIEIAPFIIDFKKIDRFNLLEEYISIVWKVYINLFDENLFSVVNSKDKQNKKIKLYKSPNNKEILSSSIILTKILYTSEIILKMEDKKRLELLSKDKLNIQDILDIYDFAYENKSLLGFDELEFVKQHKTMVKK